MEKRHKPAYGVENLRHDLVGCVRVITGNVIAYFIEVGERIRMEREAAA
jgi:hypothetical protein